MVAITDKRTIHLYVIIFYQQFYIMVNSYLPRP